MTRIFPVLILRNSEEIPLKEAWDITTDEAEHIKSKHINDEVINLMFDFIRVAVRKSGVLISEIGSIEFRKEWNVNSNN